MSGPCLLACVGEAADSDNDSVVAVLNFHVSHSKGAPKSAGPKGGSVPRSVMDAVFARYGCS